MNDNDELFGLCDDFCEQAEEYTKKDAADKDPKAKVRNRGECVFPAEHPKVKDDKDHFLLNDQGQARAALSYAGHYGSAPPWFKGTLEELKAGIRRKVKAKFPSIDVSEPKKKKASEMLLELSVKYGQAPAAQNTAALQDQMDAALRPFGYSIVPGSEVRVLPSEKTVAVDVKAFPNAKWLGTAHQAGELSKLLAPLAPGMKVDTSVSWG